MELRNEWTEYNDTIPCCNNLKKTGTDRYGIYMYTFKRCVTCRKRFVETKETS